MLGVVIETERLLLRRVTIDDIDELVAIQADPDITRFMDLFDHDEAIDWLQRVDRGGSAVAAIGSGSRSGPLDCACRLRA
jgi:RimJ/RimL family protein N-acetyltransferase